MLLNLLWARLDQHIIDRVPQSKHKHWIWQFVRKNLSTVAAVMILFDHVVHDLERFATNPRKCLSRNVSSQGALSFRLSWVVQILLPQPPRKWKAATYILMERKRCGFEAVRFADERLLNVTKSTRKALNSNVKRHGSRASTLTIQAKRLLLHLRRFVHVLWVSI
jgi:hypothetical protein